MTVKFGNLLNRYKSFGKNENGATALIFGLMTIPIFLLAGGSLDFSRAVKARNNLVHTIDAAALAACANNLCNQFANAAQRDAYINQYVNANWSDSNITPTINPSFIGGDNTLTLTASADVPTTFLNLVYLSKLTVNAEANVKPETGKIEVALVLDNTGSMSWGSKMQDLKNAANMLVDTLYAINNADQFIKMAVVPYDTQVNVGTQYWNKGWLQLSGSNWKKQNVWEGCTVPRNEPHDITDTGTGSAAKKVQGIYVADENDTNKCRIVPLLRLTNQKQTIKNKINSMVTADWTYIPVGLWWGWKLISPKKPFTQAKPYDDPEWKKAIVLMTDGDNTKYYNNQDLIPNGSYSNKGDADTVTTSLCNNIKAKGIKIYTVAFQAPSAAQNLLANCATTQADYFNAANSQQLQLAFATIAGDITNLRLSK